jgi:hypothetical protein
MIQTTNTATISVSINDTTLAWSYALVESTARAHVSPSGTITVECDSGAWTVTYVMESTRFQLFSAIINTNTSEINTLTDFNQIIGLVFDPNVNDAAPGETVVSTASFGFLNLGGSVTSPVGMSFSLMARTVEDLHVIISHDPQVKNGEVPD